MKAPIYLLFLVFLSFSVFGLDLCFPEGEYCGQFFQEIKHECSLNPTWHSITPWGSFQTRVLCQDVYYYENKCYEHGSDFLCKNAMKLGEYYYCNIDNVVFCPQGCDISRNQCYGSVAQPDCSEGYQRCGTTDNYDPEGDVYKCKSGVWELHDSCDKGCVEKNYDNAQCKYDTYYCQRSGITCYESSFKLGNCYDTEEECRDQLPIWCLSATKSECNKRYGQCLAGETEFRGSDIDGAYRNCADEIVCTSNSDCNPGFHCVAGECKASSGNIREPNFIDNFTYWLGDVWKNLGGLFFWVGVIGIFLLFGKSLFGSMRHYGLLFLLVLLVIWLLIKIKDIWF